MDNIAAINPAQVSVLLDGVKSKSPESTKEFEKQVNQLFVDMMMKSMMSQSSLFGTSSSEMSIHKELYMNILSDELADQIDIGAGAVQYNETKEVR